MIRLVSQGPRGLPNMNKTRYSNFHTYTEAKNEFILAEERKSIKTNKSLETKKPKDNSSVADNARNNKNKVFNQKKIPS